MSRLAIIGGTGIEELEGLETVAAHNPQTPYGQPSRAIQEGRFGGARVLFLQRHGSPAAIPPHRVNYRANLWALRSLGASEVIAVNAVGGIAVDMTPGRLVVPDQLIDYTWGREHTIDDGSEGFLRHIDFTEPYDRGLRSALVAAAANAGIDCLDGGVHGVAQGPRLETAAEIQRMAGDGCTVVGMTGMPEASLARELELAYASVCMVVNPAAGLGQGPITLEAVRQVLLREAEGVRVLLRALLAARYGA